MTDLSLLSSAPVIPVLASEEVEERQDLNYLAAFAALGLFFAILSTALTPAEWRPDGTVALAPEMASDGLTVSRIAIPEGLQITQYSAH